MSFPADVLDLEIELLIDGVWTAITSPTRGKDRVTVTRGRSSEGAKVDPSKCKLSVNNRDGDLFTRNPTGQYYGLIGRNTRIRARLDPAPGSFLLLPAASSQTLASDTAGLSITADLDVRIDVQRDEWAVAAGLAGKYSTVSDQRSWALTVAADRKLEFRWSPDGTFAGTIVKASTAAVAVPASGRLAVRATLDVNNGAAGNTVTFYTAPTIAGPWVQLGATVVTAGTTSVKDSTASLKLGGVAVAGVGDGPKGRVHGFQLLQGIGGTLRADLDLSGAEAGDSSFTDGAGNTVFLFNDASIVTPAIRFQGEVSEWPQRWDISGTDVYVPLEASGILRRLSQGASPLSSTLYRGLTTLANLPKAYWPCEDGADATVLASALGDPPMTVTGTPDFASSTDFKCSQPLPKLADSEWLGRVPAYTGTGLIHVWWLMSIPTGAATVDQAIITVNTSGTATSWRVEYAASDGGLRVRAFDAAGTELLDSGALGFFVNDRLLRMSLQLEQNGANIDWSLNASEVGVAFAGGIGGTLNSRTVSRCDAVRVNSNGDLGADVVIGHVAVHDEILDLFDLDDELDAYTGETAGRRVERLCAEEGVAFRAVGDLDATAAMGAQLPAELLSLLQDAADADGGILHEPRDLFGLAYRTRESLYRQAPRLALDYSLAHLSGIELVDDDQATRNDVTVSRPAGSSARAVEDAGPLSVQAPPDGVGKYDDAVPLNLEADSQLQDAAGWLLHLGTVDEARFPVLSVDLARGVFVADSDLSLAVQDLDVGDRLTVDHPPAWLPPDLITQLAQGFTETMSNFTHLVDYNCSPESPWAAPAVYADDQSRYSSDGTTLAEALDSTETGVDVTTPTGPKWSHADGDFDVRVGGEVMTVTAITGTGASQTLTVTRSVNSVVKAHSFGAEIALDHPRAYVR